MGNRLTRVLGLTGALAAACGAGTPPPEEPAGVEHEGPSAASNQEPAELATPEPTETEESSGAEATSESESEPQATPPVEPKFTENMSVEEAIQAVPQGMPRLNMEDELLSKPLTQPSLYAPCKPSGSFKVRVAVWNGKAVGVDVTTQPNNPKLQACLEKQIRAAEWEDKVRSLNTVQYSY